MHAYGISVLLFEKNSMVTQHSSTQCDQNSVKAKLDFANNTKLEGTKRKLQDAYQEDNDGAYMSFVLIFAGPGNFTTEL